MFITLPSWEAKGAPKSLVAPGIPWYSVSAMADRPIFLVLPTVENERIEFGCRMFSDVEPLLKFVASAVPQRCTIYAVETDDSGMSFVDVSAIGSYPCPKTGIKNYVYVSDQGVPRPAHACQPYFINSVELNIELAIGH